MRLCDLLRLLRLIVFGLPLLLICLLGMVVCVVSSRVNWSWLDRLDDWLTELALDLEEGMR